MNWIEPILRLALVTTFGQTGNVEIPDQIFTTEVTVGFLLFDFWGIEGESTTHMEPPWMAEGGRLTFSPFQSDYYLRTYFTFKGFTLGYEHLCTHPSLPGGYDYVRRYGGTDSVYFEFDLAKFNQERGR